MGVFRSVVAVPVYTLLTVALIGRCAAQVPYPTMQPPPPAPSTVPDPYPAVQNPAVPLNGQLPLTPDEKRQQEIDKYDPRNPMNPAKQPLPGEQGATSAPNPTPNRKASQTNPNNQETTPLPGSVAESNQQMTTRANPPADGPDVVTGESTSDQQNYAGPAVLSRSYTISRPMDSKEVKWQWSVNSSESWQNGLVNVGANGQANTSGSSFSENTSISVGGRHLWKRDEIGLNYTASYSRYFASNAYNGTNQALSLDYQHYFSRHLSFNVVESGSIVSQNYSLENPLTAPGVTVANLDLSASPSSQVLDQKVRQFMTQVSLTWQKSARLSFDFSSGFFAVDRGGTYAGSNVGYQSQADVNYRYTRKGTVGAYYSHTSYVYSQRANVSDSHTVGLIYSYALNRTTQLRLRAGVAFLETTNLTLVAIDPAFAALVGPSGVADIYQRHTTTDLSGQFVKDFSRKKSANISYAHGIAPGNGLILTSIQEVISGGFSAVMFRNYSLTLSGGRSTLTSAGAGNTGSYTSEYAGIGISRQLRRGPSASFSVNYQTYAITNQPGIQHQFRITSGLSWGPGPGRLW